MSAAVVVLGLWALGLVALAWVVVLSRMMAARREADEGRIGFKRCTFIFADRLGWGDTLPMR